MQLPHWVLWELNEIMYMKSLEKYLLHREYEWAIAIIIKSYYSLLFKLLYHFRGSAEILKQFKYYL